MFGQAVCFWMDRCPYGVVSKEVGYALGELLTNIIILCTSRYIYSIIKKNYYYLSGIYYIYICVYKYVKYGKCFYDICHYTRTVQIL